MHNSYKKIKMKHGTVITLYFCTYPRKARKPSTLASSSNPTAHVPYHHTTEMDMLPPRWWKTKPPARAPHSSIGQAPSGRECNYRQHHAASRLGQAGCGAKSLTYPRAALPPVHFQFKPNATLLINMPCTTHICVLSSNPCPLGP